MKLYLGIDGGGTGTKLCLINEKSEVVFIADGKRSSIDTITFDESFNNINEVLKTFDFSNYKLVSVFAGIGGIANGEHQTKMIDLLRNANGVNEDTLIIVENDVTNALASGLLFDSGMTLIVGTGMAAFGKNGNKTHRAGGWGYKEGDAGSSYDLGIQAVRSAIRSKDNRIVETNFTSEVSERIGLINAIDIINIMDELSANRTKMASLAPIVTKYANLGDEHAVKIVDVATSELALAVSAVYQTLNFKNVVLVIVGSLGNASGLFKELLHEKINQISDKITIIAPKVDPAEAAALLAKHLKEEDQEHA